MTPEDRRLSEIAARLAEVTARPWCCLAVDEKGRAQVVSEGFESGRAPLIGVFPRAADARFVANAPEDVAWLLEQLGAAWRGRI